MKSLKSVNLKLPSFSLSPVTKWILTILILGVGVVLVVVLYAQEQNRNNDLRDQVDAAGRTLVQNSLARRDMENRLALANLTSAELTVNFPSSEQSMDVEEALFRAAADAGVEVMGINCGEVKATEVGNSTYETYAVSISVTGETQSLLRFAGVLGYWLPSASIESSSMGSEDMTLTLSVYAWGG